MQLGKGAGLRPIVHELPRHELKACLLEHAARARVVLDDGREQGPMLLDVVEVEPERRARNPRPQCSLPIQ